MGPNLLEIFASYTSWKCGEDTWIINFMGGSQNMYLLEGKYGALLIDTGWGSGTLRAYVEKLTSKPVTVFLTHGHLDHAGGCGEWESVRMHPGAEADLKTCCRTPFDISTLPHSDFEHVLVKDRTVIDLGDRTVELLDISAHSNGSLNHYAYGSVVNYAVRHLAGFQPLEPGCRRVRIQPQLDARLGHMNCMYQSASGKYVNAEMKL